MKRQPSPLQRERRRRGLTQAQVVVGLNDLAWRLGYSELGIDANAISRHERGVIKRPRDPVPELYARFYGVPVDALWPLGTMDGMDRRAFLQIAAATGGAALLPGDDNDLAPLTAITSGFRRLEATTPAPELQGPVLAHLRLVGQRIGRGPKYAAAAAEIARFAAWLAWDQNQHEQARALYQRAVRYAERSRNDVVVAYMHGSWALWAAETGHGTEALRVARRVQPAQPISAWLGAVRATVAASVGDADATLAALRNAEHSLTLKPLPSGLGISPLTPDKLHGYMGRSYAMLGLHKAAVPALREAIAAGPPAKQRAALLLDLARALGAGEQARELRTEAHRIGLELRSRKILARLEGRA